MSSEVSQAKHRKNRVCPNICSLVVLQYHSRTYWDHGHSDAHGCERRVGYCAALIRQPDAVVIAEESSLVRREGRLVQKHGNKQHCMVGHTWAEESTTSTGKPTEKHTKTEISVKQTASKLPTDMYLSYASHPVFKTGHRRRHEPK